MASCITSITSILLILVAPAYCGDLFAQGFLGSYWSIDDTNNPFVSTRVTDDYECPACTGTGDYFFLGSAFDCTTGRMWSTVGEDILGGPYWLAEVDPMNGEPLEDPSSWDSLTDRISGLEFVNGQLYGWSSTVDGRRGLVKINTASGVLTEISSDIGIDTIVGMAYDLCTGTMYGITYGAILSGSHLVIINLDTGYPAFVEDGNTGINWVDDIAFDDDCALYGVGAVFSRGELISIDLDDIGNPTSLGRFEGLDGTSNVDDPDEYVTGLVNVRDDCGSLTPTASPTIAPTASPTKSPTSPTKSPNYSADGDDDDDDSSSDDDDDSSSY